MRYLIKFLWQTEDLSHDGRCKSTRGKTRGFSLLELLTVIAIIIILAGIAAFNYFEFIQKAQKVKAIADIKNIATTLDGFYQEHQRYPDTLAEAGLGGLLDPWGNPYHYVNINTAPKSQWRRDRNAKPINTGYDLWSNGPDGQFQAQVNAAKSQDDIIRAWDGAFVGEGKAFDDLWNPKP